MRYLVIKSHTNGKIWPVQRFFNQTMAELWATHQTVGGHSGYIWDVIDLEDPRTPSKFKTLQNNAELTP